MGVAAQLRMQLVVGQSPHVAYFAGSFQFQQQQVQHLVACLVCVEQKGGEFVISVRSASAKASEALLALTTGLLIQPA